jgi:hypothetical protein
MPSRKRLLILVGAATVLVLATGVYAFGFYLPNRPANIFKVALTNTADGYDQLAQYVSTTRQNKTFRNAQIDGTYKIDSSVFSTDGSFSEHNDGKNASFSGDIGLATTRLQFNGIVKGVPGTQTPDAYLKVSGIKGLGAQFGMPALDGLDGQWIDIDHTFFDNLLKQARSVSGNSGTLYPTTPSGQDLTDATKVLGDQSRKYLFSTDSSTAVFAMNSFVGKETVDGKTTNHYKVTVNKDHLKTYLSQLGRALDNTKLNSWAKANYNKSLSGVLDLQGMTKSADSIKAGDTFDLWVNTHTKLVHKIRISDKQDPTNNYFELGLNYNGGHEKPLFFNAHTKQDGVGMAVSFGLQANTQTNVLGVNISLTNDDGRGAGAVTFSLNATSKPTSKSVDATVPVGAISLDQAFTQLGLGSYYGDLVQGLGQGLGAATTSQGDNSDPFTVSL